MTAETPPLTRGRPGTSCRGPARTQKHPRLRGEDRPSRQNLPKRLETPPLTRGRPPGASDPRVADGNTPAYAGKTHDLIARLVLVRKHPRLRGEDHRALRELIALTETPPLTRGRPDQEAEGRPLRRNTPAYAGKTSVDPMIRAAPKETPPLTRGRPTATTKNARRTGNTPAYAGKTVRCPDDEGRTEGNTPAYAGKTENLRGSRGS